MFKSHSRATFNICHIHMFKVRATSCISTGLSQAGNEQGHKLMYFCPGKRMKGLGDIWQSSWGVDPEFYNKECACVDNEASSSDVQRSTSSRHWFHEGRKVPGSLDVFSKIRTQTWFWTRESQNGFCWTGPSRLSSSTSLLWAGDTFHQPWLLQAPSNLKPQFRVSVPVQWGLWLPLGSPAFCWAISSCILGAFSLLLISLGGRCMVR